MEKLASSKAEKIGGNKRHLREKIFFFYNCRLFLAWVRLNTIRLAEIIKLMKRNRSHLAGHPSRWQHLPSLLDAELRGARNCFCLCVNQQPVQAPVWSPEVQPALFWGYITSLIPAVQRWCSQWSQWFSRWKNGRSPKMSHVTLTHHFTWLWCTFYLQVEENIKYWYLQLEKLMCNHHFWWWMPFLNLWVGMFYREQLWLQFWGEILFHLQF